MLNFKVLSSAVAAAAICASAPAFAGTFLVEVGSNLGSPNGSGSNDVPRFRVTNTTAGSATTPTLDSLVLSVDPTSPFTISAVTNFAGGTGTQGGADDSPGVGTPASSFTTKSATLLYANPGAVGFDPGAYSAFSVNFDSPTSSTTDFRNVLFSGLSTLTGTFSDGTVGRVTFTGNVSSSTTSVSFTSTPVVAAVPEPATWAMMFLGFGMIGATARYRRRATKVAYA